MTIFDRLKYELGTRNASKYFPGTEGDTVLQSYVDDGIELLAERRPTKVKQVVTVAESTQTIDLPEKLWRINVIWSATRKYLPTKPYEVYPGDYLLGVIEEEQSEYPGDEETRQFGDFNVDKDRKIIEFTEAIVGDLTLYGFGMPIEDEMKGSEKRLVGKYALGTALTMITPQLMAKMDINLQGLEVKQKTAEYKSQGEKLLEEFDRESNIPYIEVA